MARAETHSDHSTISGEMRTDCELLTVQLDKCW
jgi:hypothetical protein